MNAVATKTSLWDLESDLQALLNSEGLAVGSEQEALFRAELAAALKATVEKRDRVFAFLSHCSAMQDAADAEIERLKERKAMFARAETRMREYIHAVIESLGTDEKGKPVKLVGNLATFALRAKPSSVLVKDEAAIPAEFKRITVTMPLPVWARIAIRTRIVECAQDVCAVNDCEALAKVSVDKTAVKKAFDTGVDVPGCDVTLGGTQLVVK